MNPNDILQKTLNDITYYFSSNQFCDLAKKYGYPEYLIIKGYVAIYLHKHALQLSTKRMWRKKYDLFEYNSQPKVESSNVDEAISLLKSLGYKIMKEVKEFKEI